jgi:hypothetical protein
MIRTCEYIDWISKISIDKIRLRHYSTPTSDATRHKRVGARRKTIKPVEDEGPPSHA